MSEKLIKMLKMNEGVETHAYKCSSNKITVGVGRNVDPVDGLGLSEDEIDYLLKNDIDRVVQELENEYVWFADLSPARRDALVDISFNLGATRLRKFRKALKAMADEDYEQAANEFMDSRWSEQVGRRAVTVTEMIRKGGYV
jgi:lysozyme